MVSRPLLSHQDAMPPDAEMDKPVHHGTGRLELHCRDLANGYALLTLADAGPRQQPGALVPMTALALLWWLA